MIRLFHVSFSPGSFFLLVSEIALIAGAFILATYQVAAEDPTDYLLNNYGLLAIGTVVLTFILGLHFHDLYSQIHVKSRVLLLQQLAMVTGIAFFVQGLLSYLSLNLQVPVRVMLAGSVMALVASFLWRLLFSKYAIPMLAKTELLMVGRSPALMALGAYIQDHPEMGLSVKRYVSEEEASALSEVVRETGVTRVVLGLSKKPDASLAGELMETRYAGSDIESAATTYERLRGQVPLDSLQPEQILYAGAFQPQPGYQRFFSGLVAALCVILALPIVMVTAVAMKLSVSGPILRRQMLVGRSGEVFGSYEFPVSDSGWASRLVRRFRLRRLPRLLNVLRGEMAIVGPEPEKQGYLSGLEAHIPFYRERYMVRPGMTGWAQIHALGPVEDTLTKLEYDFYYIKHMSLGMDTLILLHTLKVFFLEFLEG